MTLSITRNQNIFNVEGEINTCSASYFRSHFIITLNSSKGLTIDLNMVTEMDGEGIKAIRQVYMKALYWNKPFAIIGKGSKDIYQALEHSFVA